MNPEPTVIESEIQDGSNERAPESPTLTDRATAVAFGGESPTGPTEQSGDNGSLLLLVGFVGAILAIGFLRSWWFPGILAGLLFILFMHELGHYLTARASGMKVTEFFLGFGPKIWSFSKGETEYGIKAIPAGAYVRIMGMTNLEDIDPAEEHRTYRAQPYWQRMMTICAGSAMHFLMAIVALFVLFLSYGYQGFNGPPWFVNVVVPGSTAATLGIEEGDQIISINGDQFANWDEFGEVVGAIPEGAVAIEIERDGSRLTLQGELGLRSDDVWKYGLGVGLINEGTDIGWDVSRVWPGDAGDQLGLQVGDIVQRVGDVDALTSEALAAELRSADGTTIEIEVQRAGQSLLLQGPLELKTSPPFRGFFGVGPQFIAEDDPGVAGSTSRALTDFGVISRVNVIGVADMIGGAFGDSGPEYDRDVVGPVPTASERVEVQASNQCNGPDTNRPLSVVGIGRIISCSESVDQVIFLLAMVNIFIGIFNLFPLLPLDGGHAAMATYERIRGLVSGTPHRVDAAKLIPVTWLVIVLLAVVGLWTATLDIFSWN